MFFRILLWLMAWRIKWLNRNDAEFAQLIAEKEAVLQFRTEDNEAKRYVSFAQGKIGSRAIVHPAPTTSIVFESAAAARRFIFRLARNPKDASIMMAAIQQGKVTVEGDMSLIMWFVTLVPYLRPKPPEES